MKRKFSLTLAITILVTTLVTFGMMTGVKANAVTNVKVIGNFETQANRDCVKQGEYNMFNPVYAVSNDVKASGDSALRVTFGTPSDNIQHFWYQKALDLSSTDYVMFYFKNEGTLPLGFNFSADAWIITAANAGQTAAPDFWIPYMADHPTATPFNTINHDYVANPVEVYDSETDSWVAAERNSVGDANGAGTPGFSIPAGFDSFVRVPLAANEKLATSQGIGLIMMAGNKGEGLTPNIADYTGKSFVIDDISIVGTAVTGTGTVTFDEYLASTVPVAGTPAAPTGLTAIAPTSATVTDGKISGTTALMEYQLQGAAAYTVCTGTEITGLAAGTYNVRIAAAGTTPAGTAAAVIVPAAAAPTLKIKVLNDLETAAKVALVHPQQYDFMAGKIEASTAAKATGKQGVKLTLSASPAPDNLETITIGLGQKTDLTKADYVVFYVKNAGTEAVGLLFAGFKSSINSTNGNVEGPLNDLSEVQVYKDENWVKASSDKALIQGSKNGNTVDAAKVIITANFSGLMRIKLSDAEKVADSEMFHLIFGTGKIDKVTNIKLSFDDFGIMSDNVAFDGVSFASYLEAMGGTGAAGNLGDNTNVYAYIIISLLCAAGITVLTMRKLSVK